MSFSSRPAVFPFDELMERVEGQRDLPYHDGQRIAALGIGTNIKNNPQYLALVLRDIGVLLRHIVLALTVVLSSGVAYAAGPSYPPYPDVWEWQAPPLGGSVVQDLSAILLSNGDVLIHVVYENHGQKTEHYHLMFNKAALDAPHVTLVAASIGPVICGAEAMKWRDTARDSKTAR
jgi:hypothetical protein